MPKSQLLSPALATPWEQPLWGAVGLGLTERGWEER